MHRQKADESLAGAGRKEDGEFMFTGYRTSASGDEKVLELDGGDGCTTR